MSERGRIRSCPRSAFPLEVGSFALPNALPVVDGVQPPGRMGVHFAFRPGAIGVVGEYLVRFGQTPLFVVAQHSPIGESAAAGESPQGEQLGHQTTLQWN